MTEVTDVGSISEDGHWIWDGHQWQAYEKTEPTIAAPAMSTNQEFIQSTEKEFETVDQNNDGVIDKEEYIAKIMEDTLKKKEAEKAPDQIMKVMTIFILIFASCTGFISQKVSSIEAEAGDLDAAADLKIADARATESSENQLLIKEEILLTEAQNLAIEIGNQKAQISQLDNEVNNSYEEYLRPAITNELLEFQYYGYIFESEFGLLPLENCLLSEEDNGCVVESYIPDSSSDLDLFDLGIFGPTLFLNYTTTGSSLDKSFEILYNEVWMAQKNENEGSISYSIPIDISIYNETEFLQNVTSLSNYFGYSSQLWEAEWALDEIEYNLSNLRYELSITEKQTSLFQSNYIVSTQYAIYYNTMAEMIAQEGNIAAYNENITMANYYYSQAANMSTAIGDNTDKWSNIQSSIDENTSALNFQSDDVETLQKDADQVNNELIKSRSEMDSATKELFEAIDNLEGVKSTLNSTEFLKSSLLNRSAAYQNGTIDNQTGMYISDEKQNSFTEEVHANSDAKYESAQKDQQEAQEMNDKLTSVSSSVLFISVANMLLGIAGGFATKKEKKKNAMILLVAGAASGVIGAIQIVPLL